MWGVLVKLTFSHWDHSSLLVHDITSTNCDVSTLSIPTPLLHSFIPPLSSSSSLTFPSLLPSILLLFFSLLSSSLPFLLSFLPSHSLCSLSCSSSSFPLSLSLHFSFLLPPFFSLPSLLPSSLPSTDHHQRQLFLQRPDCQRVDGHGPPRYQAADLLDNRCHGVGKQVFVMSVQVETDVCLCGVQTFIWHEVGQKLAG